MSYIPKFFGVAENLVTGDHTDIVLVIKDEDFPSTYVLASDQELDMDFAFLKLVAGEIANFGYVYDFDLDMSHDDEEESYKWVTLLRAVELGILDMWEEEDEVDGYPIYSWTFGN